MRLKGKKLVRATCNTNIFHFHHGKSILRVRSMFCDLFRCQIDRLEQIKLEEMIDYHGGLLNEDFTKAIVNLYDHVRIAQNHRPPMSFFNDMVVGYFRRRRSIVTNMHIQCRVPR
jgi:hypothetical protein